MASPAKPLPPIEDDKLWALLTRAEDIGLRLEVVETGIVWEAMPGLRHQELAVQIYSSIVPKSADNECQCYRALDVYVRFPSGIVKRPDISIFCKRPAEEEGFVFSIPEAVVEITSPDSEAKDLIDGPPIYLANGVKDVVVLDRVRSKVHHWTSAGKRQYDSPTTLELSCGCRVTL